MLALPEHATTVDNHYAVFVRSDGRITVQGYNALKEAGEEVVWCEDCQDWQTPGKVWCRFS